MKTTKKQNTARLPRMTIVTTVFVDMIDTMRDEIEQGKCFNDDALNQWAFKMGTDDSMAWAWEQDHAVITIEFPTWPLGFDNDRLHAIYNRAKRKYMDYNCLTEYEYQQQRRLGTKPTLPRYGTGRPMPEPDPQKANNSDDAIEAARRTKFQWEMIGSIAAAKKGRGRA